jgi:glutaconate CoA-transferase subunit B
MTKTIRRMTRDEIMVSVAAKEVEEGDLVFVGQGYPILAAIVAKKMHAPNALFMMEGGVVDFEPYRPPRHIAQAGCARGAAYYCDLAETFSCHLRSGFVDVGFIGAAQLDKYGNVNSSYVGDPKKDPIRITGSGGAHEIGAFSKKTLIILRHGKFVEKLDYLTTPGYLEGYDSREKAGLSGGPAAVITPKGVFRFDKETKEMYLESYHPGSTVDEIKSEIPWDLRVAPDVKRTAVPSDEEIAIMREIAPLVALGYGFSFQVTVENLMKFSRSAA